MWKPAIACLLAMLASTSEAALFSIEGMFPETTEIVSGPQPGQVGPATAFSLSAEWQEPFIEEQPGIYRGALLGGHWGAYSFVPGAPVFFFNAAGRIAVFGDAHDQTGLNFVFSFDLKAQTLAPRQPNTFFGLRHPFPVPFNYRDPMVSAIYVDPLIRAAPFVPTPLPEPGTWLLLFVGMTFVGAASRTARANGDRAVVS